MLSLISCLVFVFQEGVTKHIIKNNLNVHGSTEYMAKNLFQSSKKRDSVTSDFLPCLSRAALENYVISLSFSCSIACAFPFFSVHCSVLLTVTVNAGV